MKLRVAKKGDVSSGTTAENFTYRSICLLSEGLLLLNWSKQQNLMQFYVLYSGRASLTKLKKDS